MAVTATVRDKIQQWARNEIAHAIAASDGYDLVYVAYDDQLNDEQIDMYLADDMPALWESMEEWTSDQQYESARMIIEDAHSQLYFPDCVAALDLNLSEEDYEEAEAVLGDMDFYELDPDDDLRFAVYDKDRSDYVKDLARNTHHQLFRVPLVGFGQIYNLMDEEQYGEALDAVSTALYKGGLTLQQAVNAAERMLPECGDYIHDGHTLDLIWYGSVDDVASAREGDRLTFTNASVVLLDRLNGSGMCTETFGTISVTVGPDHQPHLDRTGFGYGWDEVAGVSMSAFRSEPTITKGVAA